MSLVSADQQSSVAQYGEQMCPFLRVFNYTPDGYDNI